MFRLIVLVTVIWNASAFPQNSNDAQAIVLSNVFADDGLGNFNYAYETSNGIKADASGQLKDIKSPVYGTNGEVTEERPGRAVVQKGSYSYTAPDGTPINVEWIAGKFQFFNLFIFIY